MRVIYDKDTGLVVDMFITNLISPAVGTVTLISTNAFLNSDLLIIGLAVAGAIIVGIMVVLIVVRRRK